MDLLIDILIKLLLFLVIPYVIYTHRSLTEMKQLLNLKLDRHEVIDLIDLKKEVSDFQYISLKEDLEELKIKLDKLIDSVHKSNP